jgi:hypothetical protein
VLPQASPGIIAASIFVSSNRWMNLPALFRRRAGHHAAAAAVQRQYVGELSGVVHYRLILLVPSLLFMLVIHNLCARRCCQNWAKGEGRARSSSSNGHTQRLTPDSKSAPADVA